MKIKNVLYQRKNCTRENAKNYINKRKYTYKLQNYGIPNVKEFRSAQVIFCSHGMYSGP